MYKNKLFLLLCSNTGSEFKDTMKINHIKLESTLRLKVKQKIKVLEKAKFRVSVCVCVCV